jgi:cobalt-zinc-cadmium efflux system outer membrane protein
MRRFIRSVCLMLALAAGSCGVAKAQHALTWDELKARFEANNPTLRAGQLEVDESKAQEITAFLRHNPNLARKMTTAVCN